MGVLLWGDSIRIRVGESPLTMRQTLGMAMAPGVVIEEGIEVVTIMAATGVEVLQTIKATRRMGGRLLKTGSRLPQVRLGLAGEYLHHLLQRITEEMDEILARTQHGVICQYLRQTARMVNMGLQGILRTKVHLHRIKGDTSIGALGEIGVPINQTSGAHMPILYRDLKLNQSTTIYSQKVLVVRGGACPRRQTCTYLTAQRIGVDASAYLLYIRSTT